MRIQRFTALLAAGAICAAASPAVADGDTEPSGSALNLTVNESDAAGADGIAPDATLTVELPTDGLALPAAGSLVCNVTANNPHYSAGAPGVIAKIRYTCTGNISGTLGVNANLYRFAPGTTGPYVPRASNNQSRPVGPLAAGTVYVPADSLPGIVGKLSDRYYAAAFLTPNAGPSSSTGSVRSNTVSPQKCS